MSPYGLNTKKEGQSLKTEVSLMGGASGAHSQPLADRVTTGRGIVTTVTQESKHVWCATIECAYLVNIKTENMKGVTFYGQAFNNTGDKPFDRTLKLFDKISPNDFAIYKLQPGQNTGSGQEYIFSATNFKGQLKYSIFVDPPIDRSITDKLKLRHALESQKDPNKRFVNFTHLSQSQPLTLTSDKLARMGSGTPKVLWVLAVPMGPTQVEFSMKVFTRKSAISTWILPNTIVPGQVKNGQISNFGVS